MKTAKTITGIVSIVLTLVIFFQSCAVTLGDAITGSESASGGAGILVGIMLLTAGIVALATRSSQGGGIFCLVFYGIAGLVAISNAQTYPDLMIWGVVAIIFALIFLIAVITHKKAVTADTEVQINHEA